MLLSIIEYSESKVLGLATSSCCVSVLTESEDEDLHQCGRCRAMFRRLADYFAHKQCKSCSRFLDSEVQTSSAPFVEEVPVPVDSGDVEPTDVVRQSIQASLSDDDECSQLPSPVCDVETTAPLEPVVDNDVRLVDTSNRLSHGSSASDQDNTQVADSTSTGEPLVVNEDHTGVNGVVVAEGLPEAPPPHQCPQCDFTSKFRDDFDQHLRRQHGISSHVCLDCSRAYTDAYKLRRHQKVYCTKTPVRKKQNVLQPGTVQPQQQQLVPRFLALDKRKKSQEEGCGTSDAPFRCRMCTEVFDDYDGVWNHVSAVHSTVAKPGICRFCGSWFANPYKLRRHVSSSVHDDVSSDVLASFKRQIDRMSISCTPEALRLLRRARAERRQQRLAEASSGNECTVCRQTFSARSALLRHRRVVHGRRTATDAAPSISCQLCGASFDRRRAYLRHRRDEHRKLPVVRTPVPSTRNCPVCDRSFTRADAAAKHRATVHSARQQLPDSVLTQSISFETDDRVLPGTEPDSSTASSTCFICAQPSPSRGDLVRHLELFHRVWVPQRDGPVPRELFDDMPAIPASLQHIDPALAAIQTQHSSASSLSTVPSEESQEQVIPDRQVTSSGSKGRDTGVLRRWTCPYCSQQSTFSTLDALYHHKVDDHRLDAVFRCVVTSCRITLRLLSDYETHVASSGHSQAAFICAVCNEHCVDQLALKSHRGSAHYASQLRRPRHSGDLQSKKSGSILCDQCGRTFTKRAALMNHRSVVHRRDSCRRYACSQCERRFVKREHLQRHVVSQHSTARPYVCRAAGCGRAFKRKDKLQEHYRCHSTERLYSCSLCGRSYRQREGLRHHERAHHRPTATDRPERRRSCRRCPATFARAGKLAEHLRTVHGRGAGKDIYAHRCDVCGKTFPRPERVRRHAEREHNVPADWSHRCAVCGKGFAGRRSYELHAARHNADGGAGAVRGGGTTTTRRCRRRTRAKTTTTNKTSTTETSPRVVVVSGRHQSRVTASCDVTPVAAAAERQTDVTSTPHCFNRFFVPSTLAGHRRQQFEQASSQSAEPHPSRLLSRVNAQTASLDRLYSSDRVRGLPQCPATERLCDTTTDNFSTHRRLSFEPLPYLRHPTRTTNDYSYYASSYHHRPATPHRTQFGFYPSAPTGFGYSSHHSAAAACAAAPRGYGLFAAEHTPSAGALPFGVQTAEPCLAGQSAERRPTEFGSGLATAFPSVMAGNYGGGGGSTAPLRPLATQHPANTYCPVPDPPTVGRWFDSVPTLLPTPVDASNLDSVCWPPRPCIDSLAVGPRYPFSIEPKSRSHNEHSTVPPSRDTPSTVAGPPCLSSVERSCLLNCSRMDSAAGPPGLMLGSRRRGVDGQIGVDTMSLGHRDAPSSVPSRGMLPLLPPW